MIFNAKDKSWGFYTNFLDCGGFIQVGITGGRWIRIKDYTMLKKYYEANCLIRIPLNKESIVRDVCFNEDLSDEEKQQLKDLR
jgi:hypothetical protein